MEPIAIIAIAAALVAVAFAVFFGRENNALRKKVVSLGEELTEATSKRKPAKQAAEPTTKSREGTSAKSNKSEKSDKADKADKPSVKVVNDPELERNLEEARDEIKDLKKTIYDLKQSSKDLKQQLSDATSDRVADVPDSDVMFALREEIATLKADNLQLQESLSSAKRSKPAPAPAPEVKREEPKPEPVASTPAASDDGSKLAQLKERYDKELATLQDEVRDLERKLKSTASNIDKQRRRADNNDRAYKITQRQYDAAQERVVLLEKQLRDAGIQPIPLPNVEPAPQPAGAAITRKSNLSSTAVLTPAALAAAPEEDIAEVETVELDGARGEETARTDEGRTVSGMRPVSYEDLAAPAPVAEAVPPQVRPRADAKPDLEADESGGHTAVLRPGTLGDMMGGNKRSLRDQESGGHTAVLNPSSLGSFLQDEADATDRTTRDEPVEVADAPAAPQIGAPAVDTEKTGKGLFGMPEGLLDDDEERDEERSTQFAFPTKMSTESENNGRLGGSAVDGGDSSVDDAWNDIDID